MIQFLSPIWLFSLLTLIIPLAIHLISQKKGKRIKFGSIEYLEESASGRFRHIKLIDFWLMLLRMAMLAIMAMILAEPQWRESRPDMNGHEQKWILFDSETHPDQYDTAVFQSIDSLVNIGYELRHFATGFPRLDPNETVMPSINDRDYWSLLRELGLHLKPNSHVIVFAQNRLLWFRGDRPEVDFNLTWIKAGELAENYRIDRIRRLPDDRYLATFSITDSSGIIYHNSIQQLPAASDTLIDPAIPPLTRLVQKSKEIELNLIKKDINPADNRIVLNPSVEILKVVIFYDEDRSEDARYVRLAIKALLETSLSSATIQMNPEESPIDFDLAFFLSANEIPDRVIEVVRSGAKLVADAASKQYVPIDSRILNVLVNSNNGPGLRRTDGTSGNGISIWTDGLGRPVMDSRRSGNGSIYQFHSRFHPMWNDLVLDPWFTMWIHDLISNEASSDHSESMGGIFADMRAIDSKQIMPNRIQGGADNVAAEKSTDLHSIFWLFALVLFLLERWLSSKRAA